ncbi:MAG: ABC transporter permease subunit [Planctomycetes bacterium]|nr:ABC transporter permease subunit [Planctomycetota bacterium]
MIARKTWREIRLMTVAYTLLIEIMLVPAILLWPKLRREVATFERLMPMQTLKNMMRAIADPDASGAYSAYMSAQMFFKGTNVVGIAGAVLFATALVARERENGTLEFLLSRPYSRTRILLSKFLVVAVALVVPIYLTSWTAIPLSTLVEEQLDFGTVTLAATHASAFVVLFAALTLLCSVVARSQAHTAFAVGAFIVIQVAIYFIQEIRIASLFQLSDFDVYGPILSGNRPFVSVFFGSTVWLLVATAAIVAVAVAQFRRAEP